MGKPGYSMRLRETLVRSEAYAEERPLSFW
jgi:hypothetical protein